MASDRCTCASVSPGARNFPEPSRRRTPGAVMGRWLTARMRPSRTSTWRLPSGCDSSGEIRVTFSMSSDPPAASRSEEHTSELQSQSNLVCRLLLEKKNDRITEHRDLPRLQRRHHAEEADQHIHKP